MNRLDQLLIAGLLAGVALAAPVAAQMPPADQQPPPQDQMSAPPPSSGNDANDKDGKKADPDRRMPKTGEPIPGDAPMPPEPPAPPPQR